MIDSNTVRRLVVALTLAVLAAPGHVLAYVVATSDLTLSNLQFSFSDPGAKVMWTDTWYGQVRAQSQDTGYGPNPVADSKDLLNNEGSVSVAADTDPTRIRASHVRSSARYVIANGADPAPSVLAETHSDLRLIEPKAQGDGFAGSIFNNYFMLASADPNALGPVDVMIELAYAGTLHGEADANGLFTVALLGLLELQDMSGTLLDQDLILDALHSGTDNLSEPFNRTYEGSLRIPITLEYGTPYFLVAEADSEVFGANAVPEPGSLPLVALLLGVLVLLRRGPAAMRSH